MSSRTAGKPRSLLFLGASTTTAVAAVVWLAAATDLSRVPATMSSVVAEPLALGGVLIAYGLAFVLRSWLWRRVLPSLPLGHALAALHVSLAGNHLLPFRLGEALRVTSVVRRAQIPLSEATASTLMLRGADVLAVVTLAAVLGPQIVANMVGAWTWALSVPAAGLWAGGLWWLKRVATKNRVEVRASTLVVALGSAAAWVLESLVMFAACRWAGIDLSFADAVLVTAVTIAAQILAVTPGGIGTYEAAATAALVALGFGAGPALAAAITAHALKTVYSFVTGGVALFVPSPGAFGRLRLPRSSRAEPMRPAWSEPDLSAGIEPNSPIVLLLPARNEELSVAGTIARAPSRAYGRRVDVLVVDDGSTDETRAVARRAGADVISLERPSGLGAAVRRGLEEAVERGACAVAFCDADGEYAPEELETLVAPILRGDADYVAGSRFAGRIGRMAPHRRIGNHVLTRILRFVSREPIGDGQSGYRAFSRRAAESAEIIHDYNYAQVLTLDLLAKGFRYLEVPISYSFRTEGRSFVRLGAYLRHVIPAVHRELNAPS
jgi:uncharacterized membrane protein YbhN (UPF0104 family)